MRWIISADKNALDLCNETVVVPAFRIEQKLVTGDNILRFTPEEAGDFVYTCWMGMIKSRIQVVEDLAAYTMSHAKTAAPSPSEEAAAAASPAKQATAAGEADSVNASVTADPLPALPPTPNHEPAGSAAAKASTAAPVPAATTKAPVAAPSLAWATEAPDAAPSSGSPAPAPSPTPQDEPDSQSRP